MRETPSLHAEVPQNLLILSDRQPSALLSSWPSFSSRSAQTGVPVPYCPAGIDMNQRWMRSYFRYEQLPRHTVCTILDVTRFPHLQPLSSKKHRRDHPLTEISSCQDCPRTLKKPMQAISPTGRQWRERPKSLTFLCGSHEIFSILP